MYDIEKSKNMIDNCRQKTLLTIAQPHPGIEMLLYILILFTWSRLRLYSVIMPRKPADALAIGVDS